MLLREYPVMDNTQGVADYAETVARAQLKKVIEYLQARSFSFQPEGESAVWVISCDLQALLKEVE